MIMISSHLRNKTVSGALLVLLFAMSQNLMAQPVLDDYVHQGLANNLVLKQKNITLEKSMLALKEARSYFLPATNFEAQYMWAQGGRTIDIPVGDLLNPVYATLNQLTGTQKFPQIQNASEQFLPNNFLDARVRTVMPLVNPDIAINRDISKQQIQLRENEIDIYQRELVKDIKVSYYNFLLANKAIAIYESALELANQNLRLNKSLLQNGKGLPAYVSRSESEVKDVETQLQSAQNARENAKAYLNFLVNRPLTDSVPVQEADPELAKANALQNITDSVTAREELKSLRLGTEINQNVLRMNKAYAIPRLNAFLDLGLQASKWQVSDKSLFYLGGLQLQVPIFNGNRNLYKIHQTELDLKSLAIETDKTKQQLELAALTSRNNARTAYFSFQSSLKQQDAARQYFNLVDRGYREGANAFIELLDARNQLTASQIQTSINQYKFLSALADHERQTATYTLPSR
jgi:outer membrane protein